MIDPRAPVVVGVGQLNQRVPVDEARPPIELFADAARLAARDSGAALLDAVDAVGVVSIGSWRYNDPGAYVSRLLGIEPRTTVVSTVGGNSPQLLVNAFASRIRRNQSDVVLIGGAESMHTRWRARREPKVHLDWDSGDDPACAEVIGDARPGASDYEMAHLAVAPTMVYPLFETALRAELRHGIAEHQRYIAELWSGFAAVAAKNPNAWSQIAYTPDEIATVSPDNRMVCFPYAKRMCSNIDVDQGAAILLCSYEAARAAGVPDDKMVFLVAAAEAHDHYFLTERSSLARSPAIHEIKDTVWSAADRMTARFEEPSYYDLYSCFPSAVEIARREIGLQRDQQLTVTGGLGFAGGPVNNYPTHGIAAMVETLRSDPGAFGCTTALGWYVTKHAMAIWSTQPPEGNADPHVYNGGPDLQARIDAGPRREPAGLVDTTATVEATSVSFERDGRPSIAIVTALLGNGRRALGNTRDADVLESLVTEPWEGRSVQFTNDGATNTVMA